MLDGSGNELSQKHDFEVLSEPESIDKELVYSELDSCLEEIGEGSVSVSDNEEFMNQCCTEEKNAYQPKGK